MQTNDYEIPEETLKEWEEFLLHQTMSGMNYAMVAVRMPREIEFRCWSPKKKRWADEIEVFKDGSFSIGFEEDDIEGVVGLHGTVYQDDDQAVLNDWTGLLDSKGVKIFEGDILEVHLLKNETLNKVGAVEWAIYNDNSHANNKHIGYVVTYFTKVFSTLIDVATFSKVIGNIYQNPELLEVKE